MDAGVIVTGVPLVTAPTPLMLPVPPVKFAVRLVEFPVVMVDAPAVKLVITGGATVVTLRVAVPLTPLCEALIVVVPAPLPVARPLLTVATDEFVELHDADAVTSC